MKQEIYFGNISSVFLFSLLSSFFLLSAWSRSFLLRASSSSEPIFSSDIFKAASIKLRLTYQCNTITQYLVNITINCLVHGKKGIRLGTTNYKVKNFAVDTILSVELTAGYVNRSFFRFLTSKNYSRMYCEFVNFYCLYWLERGASTRVEG